MSFARKSSQTSHFSAAKLAQDLRGWAQGSIESFERALEIARVLEDRKGEARALGSIGNASYILGDAQRANESYEQSLTIWREITGGSYKWKLEDALGQEHQSRVGEALKGAITACEIALVVALDNKDRLEAASISNILAMLLYEQGLLDKALHFAESAVDIYEEIGSTHNAQLTRQLIALIQKQLR
jgi:tetratricopeptide (TPR) repeat protein